MLSLSKDDRATVDVTGWGEAVAATSETIRTALQNQLADKRKPTITIQRSDRYLMEVDRWRVGYTLRVMHFDADRIIRKAWWAAPATYQGSWKMGWLETILRSNNSKILQFEEAISVMTAFVEGRIADIPHKWVPEYQ